MVGLLVLVVAGSGVPPGLRTNLELAQLLRATGAGDQSRARLTELCADEAGLNSPTLSWQAGWIALTAGQDPDLARRIWRAAPERAAASLAVLAGWQIGQPAAIADGRLAVELAPDSPDAHWALAQAYFYSAEWPDAASELDQVLARTPDNAEAWSLRGRARVRLGGDQNQARGEVEKAYRLAPDDPVVIRNLFSFYMDYGPQAAAEPIARRGLAQSPGDYDYNIGLGEIAVARGDYAAAQRYYGVALQTRPDHPQIHVELGLLYEAMGRPEAAIQEYREDIRLAPQESSYYIHLFTVLDATGDHASANQALCTGLTSANPNEPIQALLTSKGIQCNA